MRLRFCPGNQGPVPPRGPNKAVIPPYLLRDFDPLPNKIPHSPASLFGNQPISINPNLSRLFRPAAGEPDPDSCPPSLLATAGLRLGMPKAGKIHSASSQPLLPDIPYSRKRMPDKYEITGFISDLKISELTRRIHGKNHYLFWDPEP
jgi:hypothetical protein